MKLRLNPELERILVQPDKQKIHRVSTKRSPIKDDIPEYRAWRSMRSRCGNPKATSYDYYGGRGITICEGWKNSFATFLKDMGRKPSPRYTLDRINPYGNYEPSNCRWATRKEQTFNTRRNFTKPK